MSLLHQNLNLSALMVAALLIGTPFVTGCSQNPYLATPGSNVTWQAQGPNYAPGTAPPGVNPAINPGMNPNDARIAELNRRVQLLDDNNRQLHTQLAQSAQQSQVYKDELKVIRDQLAETTQQFESTRLAARNAQSRMQNAESQVRGMQASSQNRGGALIRANTNLKQLIGRLNLKGVPVQQDGDVIRIVVPADQLFQPGTAQPHQQATLTLDPIVAQLRSVFPQQRIGIEGYTDNSALYGGQVATSHQLASAQAAAVLDIMTRRGGMPMNQLFTVAQGSNNPRQPNSTAAGRAANRRVELVIYPETF
ncbi:OmpA/MotB family protein [Planctomycetes bacterium K23_9]|uniref:Motility protein B n=1 Tax=Stieleria marina TaxID=1930275 RepID=A0A517P1X2_9BACT|nr:Motility protein B [Planctomycetes bacterium K23_9]